MRTVSYIHFMNYILSDKQALFPPTSVKLKQPFAVKPWNGSDENVANLLMVTFPILFIVKFFRIDVISVTNVSLYT